MAKAIYEKRSFTDRNTGNTVNYEVYAITSDVDGERMELNLAKTLSPAEKIAWKMISSGDDTEYTVESRKASNDEQDFFKDLNSSDDKIDLED